MSAPLPKRFGKKMPPLVDNGGRICFQMQMPDALEYRAALMGQLNDLGFWFTWDHTEADYSNIPVKNEQVAQLWLDTVADASFEVCMDFCAQMIANAECFLNDPGVQTQLITQLLSNPAFTEAISQIAGKGIPMPGPEIELPVTTTCDEDALFGGVTSIIRQMNTNNEDFFEKIEVGSNAQERTALILGAVPVLETLPIDEIVEFSDQILENIFENYAGEYTTALEDEYRCDIFCLALDAPDCAVTFDMLFKYFSDRLGGQITIESILAEGIAFIATGTWNGTEIVDAMMLAQVVLWRAASNFLGVNIRTLQTVGLLGQNNPDHDWSLLCDCVTPPPDCVEFDFLESDQGWDGLYGSNYTPAVGWGANMYGNVTARWPASTIAIHNVTAKFEGVGPSEVRVYSGPTGTTLMAFLTHQGDGTWTADLPSDIEAGWSVEVAGANIGAGHLIYAEFCPPD